MIARGARKRQRGDSRVGTVLAIIGCLGALGGAFGVGLYSGWYWARSSAGPPGPKDRTPVAVARPAAPALTFYQELTAPLGPSPAPARSPLAERRPARPSSREEAGPARREHGERRSDPVVAASAFTVQVGAYRDRASAETLRASITAAGHDAYVAEVDGPSSAARYRVRVGSFATREAAAATVARLERDGQRAAYVTSR